MAVTHVFESPEDPELKAAIEYFLNFPPKKQVVNDGVLAWDQTPIEEKIIAKNFNPDTSCKEQPLSWR
ncbi:hypothetical protein CUA56_00535 [Shigella boydii]|nr:hypothetical protein [Escherichia coli]RIG42374.1 hypothetical protein CUA56_00535 [Shigella boydii]